MDQTGARQLKRILGAPTALCIGVGVAIGSGVFRTPGEIAKYVSSPWALMLVWVCGGLFVLAAGLVTAELATRFPQAGGEYVFLREAYGRFVAFFFGWAYTFFIVGGGAATIARAMGDFGCQLFSLPSDPWSGWLAAIAIAAVTVTNCLGLKTGAGFQNLLTVLKVAAMLAVVVLGLSFGQASFTPRTVAAPAAGSVWMLFVAAFIQVQWTYDGSTDSVKMAEEIKDVRRALPRALVGSAVALTVVYLLVNVSLLRVMTLDEMAGRDAAPADALHRLFGKAGLNAILIIAMLACLGSLSSTVLATIRVTYALARDGLTFRFLSGMSRAQAPVPAFLVVGAFAIVLAVNREFGRVLGIYMLASAVLFSLSYASLIVFRWREGRFPEHAFRCPLASVLVAGLIVVEGMIAWRVVADQPADAAYTGVLLAALGGLYLLWPKRAG